MSLDMKGLKIQTASNKEEAFMCWKLKLSIMRWWASQKLKSNYTNFFIAY